MTQVVRPRHVGDTRSLVYMQLTEENSAGTSTAVDLTGLSASNLKFRMVDARGTEVLAATSTGISIRDAATGKISMQLPAAAVAAAGTFYAYISLTDENSRVSVYPREEHGFVIPIESD